MRAKVAARPVPTSVLVEAARAYIREERSVRSLELMRDHFASHPQDVSGQRPSDRVADADVTLGVIGLQAFEVEAKSGNRVVQTMFDYRQRLLLRRENARGWAFFLMVGGIGAVGLAMYLAAAPLVVPLAIAAVGVCAVAGGGIAARVSRILRESASQVYDEIHRSEEPRLDNALAARSQAWEIARDVRRQDVERLLREAIVTTEIARSAFERLLGGRQETAAKAVLVQVEGQRSIDVARYVDLCASHGGPLEVRSNAGDSGLEPQSGLASVS